MPDDLALAIQALQDITREPARAVEIADAALADIVRRKMGLVACPEGRVPVRIPALEAGHSGWAKWVLSTNPKERGGFMFDGPFLPLGQASPLPPGAVVLIADGVQQRERRNIHRATAYIVQANGQLGGNPISEHRSCWDELAERIVLYLKDQRGLPLIAARQFPARLEQYGPPIPIEILLAAGP